ncbi:cysteine proteinase [Sporormia fimetaria CBS 119925]|uniref:Cysteine proteinase n=1 Tax=Sporormia fimetaria CBS 119925 TaxID=1340428 RepID=A0A6A6VR63_9PLEO|nr:cysteine proteinase [Sporormia fimetaria CBS 119925]
MNAMRLADPEEQKALKRQAASAMDLAERIKVTVRWTPPAAQATTVTPKPNSTTQGTMAIADYVSSSSPVTVQDHAKAETNGVQHDANEPLIDLSFDEPVKSAAEHRAVPTSIAVSNFARAPVSTRKQSRREEIILLKAGKLNGCKFPIWTGNPPTSEFILNRESKKFRDTTDLSLSTYQKQHLRNWFSVEDALPPPSLCQRRDPRSGPVMYSNKPIDLVQDAASDCSVVASLCAAVSRFEHQNHEGNLLESVTPTDSQREHLLLSNIWPRNAETQPMLSTNGKYVLRLNFNGCWRKVVIDDRLPVSKTHRLLHVIDRNNPSLLWPALIEKAYLKVRGGYDFPGSNSCSDLWALTGWIPEEVYLQESDTVPDRLWNRLQVAFSHGDILFTLGTGKLSETQERELGLESQHSYAVLDLRQTAEHKLLLIKNPWLEGKRWRGPTPKFSAAEALPDLAPSTFWVEFDHVIRYFERAYLNWNPALFRFRQDIHFEWTIDVDKDPAACIINHPQFAFSCKRTGPVFFLLSRHFQDEIEPVNNTRTPGSSSPKRMAVDEYTSISVYDGRGQHMYVKRMELAHTPFVSTPQCLLRWEATGGQEYTIVIHQYQLPTATFTFSLSAFANSAIDLEKARYEYPFEQVEYGAWMRDTAGGDTQSSAHFKNPQYALEIREPTSLAVLLSGTSVACPLNVKLVLGQGKRVYKLQSRDVIADSGDYQSGCAFAEAERLEPGMYTIICSLYEAGKTGAFSLRVDSSSEVGVKPIPRDGAGLLSVKMAQPTFGPKEHKLAAPIRPRRLATVTLAAAFSRATSPVFYENIEQLARSPFRLSIEQGRGPNRRFLIASEGGEYSNSDVVRTESLDLEPAMLHYGDLFIVIDRLSLPGGPIEAWYEFQLLTDVKEAFQLGVWRNWDD